MLRLIGFLLIVASFSIGWCWMAFEQAVDRILVKDTAVIFEVQPGDSLGRISERLRERKIMSSPIWFKILVISKGQSNHLKAGEYKLQPGVTARHLLDLIVTGRVQQYSLTLVEGWTFRQMLAEVCRNPAIVVTVCEKNSQAIMNALGPTKVHPEGRFFPDTYFLIKGTSDVAFLQRARRAMDKVLAEEWQNKADELPLKSSYEALILASIIEKETGRSAERGMIAGVFTRRLNLGMLLQTDPTVIYGMGERFDGNIRSKDLTEDTPYNTYVHAGLPPTPIAMPGAASIHAALHPEEGSSLYFVARGDGGHIFSSSLSAHNRAVNQYQRRKKGK